MTFLKIVNIIVAMMVATVVRKAAIKEKILKGKEIQRQQVTMGAKTQTKFRARPERKQPNMMCEATFTRERMLLTSTGRAMVAPDKS